MIAAPIGFPYVLMHEACGQPAFFLRFKPEFNAELKSENCIAANGTAIKNGSPFSCTSCGEALPFPAASEKVILAACALIASDINVYPMMSRADAVASGYDRLNAAVDKWTALQPAQCVTAQSQPIASQPETP